MPRRDLVATFVKYKETTDEQIKTLQTQMAHLLNLLSTHPQFAPHMSAVAAGAKDEKSPSSSSEKSPLVTQGLTKTLQDRNSSAQQSAASTPAATATTERNAGAAARK